VKGLRPAGPWVVLVLALVLAAAGVVPKADNVTHRVLELAEQVPWADWYRPLWMPWPIEAWALRPLSVVLLKTHVALWGSHTDPPALYELIRATVELGAFGLAGRAWLRAAGFERVATWAACSSMMIAPALFQAWYVPELDMLAGAATLFASSLLIARRPLTGPRTAALVAALAVPLMLKEASALVLFGFLGAGVLVALKDRDKGSLGRQVVVTVACLGFWIALFTPLLLAPTTEVADSSWAQKLPLVENNLVQLVYLLSPPGACLLVSAAALRLGRVAAVVPVLLLAGLVASPLVVYYSHYEAIYLSPRLAGAGFVLLLLVGLTALAGRRGERRTGGPQLAALTVGLVLLALSLAGLMAPSAREDMASRIFIALAPLLHGVALHAGQRLLGSPARHGALALVVAMAWWVVANGLNYTLDWRARMGADLAGKQALAEEALSGDVLLFNHYVEWLDPHALITAGARDALEAHYLHVPAWLPTTQYNAAGWIWPDDEPPPLLTGHAGDTWIYWLTPRSRMDDRANAALIGDLSWTRREAGLFTPVVPGGPNRPEDYRATIYRPGPSHLEAFGRDYGELRFEEERPFVQLPLLLTELPRRLLLGVPWVERYAYEVRVIAVDLR